jgi:MFS family permease
MGVLLATTCVAELPFFFYSGAITEYFGSFGVMIIAISCLSIRLGVYSIANAGYQVVLVDSLHGISFGSGWGAMSGFVNKYSPRGAESTMQGILQATSMGLGVGIGSIVSGFLYDGSGPVNMFRYGSYIGLFPLFSYSIYVFYQQISKIWNNVRPKISHNPKLESVHGHYEAIPALNEN